MTLANTIPEWTEQAVCASVSPDDWYPEGKGKKNNAAKRICRTCPVRAQCLEYALDNEEQYGIWAGYTDRELRRIRLDAGERASILAELRGVA